jgi:RimJ/RimL family protein N-acetyltransferase
MFARTSRLLLRPGWAEDAQALVGAMSDAMICRDLWSAPWPFTIDDAQAALAAPADPVLPSLLVFERTGDEPRLIGACGLRRRSSGAVELYVWIVRQYRGRGFGEEACRAVLDIARTLGLPQVEAAHFADSPAACRLLTKLGFRSTGISALRSSSARQSEAPIRLVRARLCDRVKEEEPLAA